MLNSWTKVHFFLKKKRNWSKVFFLLFFGSKKPLNLFACSNVAGHVQTDWLFLPLDFYFCDVSSQAGRQPSTLRPAVKNRRPFALFLTVHGGPICRLPIGKLVEKAAVFSHTLSFLSPPFASSPSLLLLRTHALKNWTVRRVCAGGGKRISAVSLSAWPAFRRIKCRSVRAAESSFLCFALRLWICSLLIFIIESKW